MRQLNRAQRAILMLILATDGLLCLFPPFLNYANRYEGHRWFFAAFGDPRRYNLHISFGQLAGEVMIVAIIGATACVLAAGIPDERTEALIRKPASWWQALWAWKVAPTAGVAILVGAVVLIAVAAAILAIEPAPAGSFGTVEQAKRHCPGDEVFHIVPTGYFMCRTDALKAGWRPYGDDPAARMSEWMRLHPNATREEIYRAAREVYKPNSP
jgi:hypothetical protein